MLERDSIKRMARGVVLLGVITLGGCDGLMDNSETKDLEEARISDSLISKYLNIRYKGFKQKFSHILKMLIKFWNAS